MNSVLLAIHQGLERTPRIHRRAAGARPARVLRARHRARRWLAESPGGLLHDQRGAAERARRRRTGAPEQGRPPAGRSTWRSRRCRTSAHSSNGRTSCMLQIADKSARRLRGVDPQRASGRRPDRRRSRSCCAAWSRTGRWCAPGCESDAGGRAPTCAGSTAMRPSARCSARPISAAASSTTSDLSGFNFRPARIKLDTVLDEIARHRRRPKPPAIYVGSTTVDTCLPGFRAENDLELGDRQPLVSVWIGNRTRIAAHHDLPDNIACVVVGASALHAVSAGPARQSLHRSARLHAGRPGDQPGGFCERRTSQRFRRFAEALQHAQVAELGAGRRDLHSQHVVASHRSRSTASTCWSTTGGASRRRTWIRR